MILYETKYCSSNNIILKLNTSKYIKIKLRDKLIKNSRAMFRLRDYHVVG